MSVLPRDPEGRVKRPEPGGLYYGWVLVVTLGVTTTISYGTTYYLFGVLVLQRDFGKSFMSHLTFAMAA